MRRFDARLHQREADAAATLRCFHRQRAQQQGFVAANPDRPEPHRAAQHAIFDRDKREAGGRGHAFAQAPGRFGETAWAEGAAIKGVHAGGIVRHFGPDLPALDGGRLAHGLPVAGAGAKNKAFGGVPRACGMFPMAICNGMLTIKA